MSNATIIGTLRSFKFHTAYEIGSELRTGEGRVVVVDQNGAGYCEKGACRIRVTASPHYKVGEVVDCRISDTVNVCSCNVEPSRDCRIHGDGN